MAPSADQIAVPMNGTIYTATWSADTTYPTTVRGTLTNGTYTGGTWAELGYTTEDGVTFSSTPNVEDINAWQSPDPVRRLVTSRETTVATQLLQWNDDTFKVAFGGGAWTGGTLFTPPAPQDALANLALIVDGEDGTRQYRFVIYKANVTDAVETSLTRTGAAVLPVTFSAVADAGETTTWKFMTDDAAFS